MCHARLKFNISSGAIGVSLSVLFALISFPSTATLAADLNLRRMPTPAEKKMLLVFQQDSEATTAEEACEAYGLKHEHVRTFGDALQKNLSTYHSVMSGSNAMDHFGAKETAKPEAFLPLTKFMQNGGHLIILGSYQGRNNEHLQQFGITCSLHGCDDFTTTPASGLFFRGAEKLMPTDSKMLSMGTFTITSPHVSLLNRGKNHDPSQPAIVTLAHQKGRLTFNLVEPQHSKDLWLITALTNWVSRGSLTPGIDGGQLPVPDAKAIASAETLIHEVLKDDYKQIDEPMGRQAWVQLMLTRDFSEETDPAVQYAAWNESRTHAAAIGNLGLAISAIDILSSSYRIDALAMKLEALSTVSRTSKDPEVIRQAARMTVDLQADAIARDNLPGVAQITPVARSLAQKSQDKHLQSLIPYYDKRANSLVKEFQKVASKSANVNETPVGDESRTVVGKYCCFVKGDWQRGLELLATGNDAGLQAIAERERAKPTKGPEQLTLADQWWGQSEDLPTEQRNVVQRHAATWYYKSLADLSPGQQSTVRKKLSKIPGAKAQLVVQLVKHHGNGQLTLTPETISFHLISWGPPDALRLNDFNWDLKQSKISNDGATRILADNVDINSAKLTQTRGRGTVSLAHTSSGLVVTIDDPPDGADNYEFKLTFGGK